MYLYLCCCQRAIAEIAASWKAYTQAISTSLENHLHSLDKVLDKDSLELAGKFPGSHHLYWLEIHQLTFE